MSSVNMSNSSQSAFPPISLQALQNTAKNFVFSAKKIADKILHPTQAPSNISSCSHSSSCHKRKVHVHHHYDNYGWGFSPFWSRPTYVIAPYGSNRNEKDDSNSALRAIVGLISVAVGGAAFYALGNTIKGFQKIERKLEENHSFTAELRNYKQINESAEGSCEYINQLEQIASLRENILQRKKRNNLFNLAAIITGATACTIAAVGAIINAPALMGGGLLLGLGVGAVALVKWGMDSDSKQKRDAKALLRAVNELPQI